MIPDEAHLHVHADIFIKVTCSVVWFSPEDRTDLEDTLKDTYHDLFVELRALCQVRGSTKVVELEYVCTALSGGGNDFRRLYLCKASCFRAVAMIRGSGISINRYVHIRGIQFFIFRPSTLLVFIIGMKFTEVCIALQLFRQLSFESGGRKVLLDRVANT